MSKNDRVLRKRHNVDYRGVDVSDEDDAQLDVNSDSDPDNVDYSTPVEQTSESLDTSGSSLQNRTVVGEEADEVVGMANARVVQLVVDLEAVFFQLEELDETVGNELHETGVRQLTEYLSEVKELRVSLVKLSSELKLLSQDTHAEHADKIQLLLDSSKKSLTSLKSRLYAVEATKEKSEAVRQQEVEKMEKLKINSRISAFKRSVTEINTMYVKLNAAYTVFHISLTREQMLKRHSDVPTLASEFDTFRSRVNSLIQQTDVMFPEKEQMLDEAVKALALLGKSKEIHEKRVYEDLVANDLTEEKRKLAQATKIDVGKFSGVLGKGDDYYTFKSKFMKAYGNHPTSLMVQWLKNNHLEGVAKDCVGSLDNLDNIWVRLKNNFGSTELMLQFHFSKLNKLGPMSRQKSYTAKKQYMQTLINVMQDSLDLATEHDLVGELHYGPQLGKVVSLLEGYLQTGWYKVITEESVQKPHRWLRMLVYLEAQLSIVQTRASECESFDGAAASNVEDKKGGGVESSQKRKGDRVNDRVHVAGKELCGLCDEAHNNPKKVFTSCRKFLTMSYKQRGELVRKKKMCLQCLDGNTKFYESGHHCNLAWICPNESHQNYKSKLHVLLCFHHAEDSVNVALLEKFKEEVLTADWQQKLLKDVGLVARSSPLALVGKNSDVKEESEVDSNVIPDAKRHGSPVFLLQPVPFKDRVYNFLFDNGCQNFVCKKAAVDSLPDECKEVVIQGPITIGGVGDTKVTSNHGHYSIKLPIHDGRLATFSGVCLDVITGPLPPYPVREVRKSVVEGYTAQGGKAKDLPNVPVLVGGDTDFLLGIQYNFFLPRLVFMLPSGLGIYESMFVGVDGTRGCIGGAHQLFTQCEKQFLEVNSLNSVTDFRVYLNQQLSLFRSGYKVCLDHNALSVENSFQPHHVAVVYEDADVPCTSILVASKTKLLGDHADAAGSGIDYRCVKCRGCNDCKHGERIEMVSLREEAEQNIINDSVTVDFAKGRTEALLPFTGNPAEKLCPNYEVALKVYRQQTKKLNKDIAAKETVLRSEDKLQQAGHVDWVANLSPKDRELLDSQSSKYYMPWRYVTNENSVSTPVRIVFDASSTTSSGFSLNDILAKGINSLNSMLEIMIRFRCFVVGMHTDVKMMYDVVKLKPNHWTFQRYLWDIGLDPLCMPTEKVIKTLIYGVKSSGNQAQCGLRITAEAQKDKFPVAARSIVQDTYVDDCATGAASDQDAEQLALDMNEVLCKGGFATKGYTFAGRPPPPTLTKDGISVSVLGYKWLSEKDALRIAFGPLSFAKKYCGKREASVDSQQVPETLTRSLCLGKVHELFDLCGLVAPLMGGFKTDLRELFDCDLGWQDAISADDRVTWIENFKLLVEIGEICFSRTVVPPGAVDLNVELISAGDASAKMTCAGCYARFKLRDGSYSCQLVLGKTKIVPEGLTLPRAELMAAVLNVHITEVVKRALGERVVGQVLVMDSEIALHWMNSETKQLKPWVRNRVIEGNRFSRPGDRFHIKSEMNPADIGTRKGVSIEDVSPGSDWIEGKPWMKMSFSEMRRQKLLSSVEDIKYRKEHLEEIKKEKLGLSADLCNSGLTVVTQPGKCGGSMKCFLVDKKVDTLVSEISTKVKERLLFSNYIIDPNRFRFSMSVRVVGIIMKASRLLLSGIGKELSRFTYLIPADASIHANHSVFEKIGMKHDPSVLSDDELQYALDYFFMKATDELKEFSQPKYYEKNSVERNSILYYAGRVDLGKISFGVAMTDAMLDLSSGSFDVPIVEKYSPIAFSIVNEIHWYHPTVKHCGVESTIRFVMNVAYVLGVRDLVKTFRQRCTRCRYIMKRTIEVPMAPASKHQLCVVPPYYVTQCDLCGSFLAYSRHNRRTTVKVWIVTFVCATTGMTNLKIMEGYDTTQFLLAFSRFSCEAGFPKLLLVDEGSQLVRGCENMSINMSDARGLLKQEYGIDFMTCPVGGHNFHGKAERKIKTVQNTIVKNMQNARLSTIQWETLCAQVANAVNNLPVAIGNETEDLECIDLITPNRLRLGRNNDRSPVGSIDVTDRYDSILKMNSAIFNAWWEAWLVAAVPKLVPQPKWFHHDKDISVGDVVIFKKTDSILSGMYQYGMIEEVKRSEDNLIRTVVVRYRNSTETVDRKTVRAVRSIVVIHRINELNIMEELGNAALLGKEVINLVTSLPGYV